MARLGPGEHGRALVQKRLHAFGKIRRAPGDPLQVQLEIELRVEPVLAPVPDVGTVVPSRMRYLFSRNSRRILVIE